MGKLMDRLQKQLQIPEHKKDAEDCIEIFNWIKDTDPHGHVWQSRWDSLVNTTFQGFPNGKRTFKPNITGYAVLKSLEKNIII